MTNREIVSSVRSQLKQISGDNIISDRAILADLKGTATLYIKRETDKRRLLSVDSLFTTVPCLVMIQVPLAECCDYTSPCKIARSKYKIPKIGEGLWGYIIDGVYSVDGAKRFTAGTARGYTNSLKLGLKQKSEFFWIQNGYLYISNPDIELVRLRAFFEEEPTQDQLACDKSDVIDPCANPMDSPFKCPGYLIKGVLDTVIQQYTQIFKRVTEDPQDNDKDE